MTLRDRFIKSVIATAQADDTQFPWTRRTTRRAGAAPRNVPSVPRRHSKLASG